VLKRDVQLQLTNLTAKFDRPTFSSSEVFVWTNKERTNTLTNKQTPLKTSTSLGYTTTVGKNLT